MAKCVDYLLLCFMLQLPYHLFLSMPWKAEASNFLATCPRQIQQTKFTWCSGSKMTPAYRYTGMISRCCSTVIDIIHQSKGGHNLVKS